MKRVIPFNDGWKFGFSGEEKTAVTLPHTWNGTDGQDGGNDYRRCAGEYAKTFQKPEISAGGRCVLFFEAVNSSCTVFLNGTEIRRHDGGYSAFEADLTDFLSENNELLVVADNTPNDRVYPQKADFTFYGGIYRDVYMEILPENCFVRGEWAEPALLVTPVVNGEDGILTAKVNVRGEGEVRIRILDAEGNVRAEGKPEEAIRVPAVRKWNGKKDPYLYTVRAELLQDGTLLDATECETGFREFHVDPAKGFFLNGESYPLRGVCRHQDRPGIGNAIGKKEHEEDIALVCEIGANTLRLAHYQQAAYFYALCDRKGIVVWAEIPYISKHMPNGHENTMTQMRELVLQNYNHPSICFWGLSNEITMSRCGKKDMLQNHRDLNDLCHALDRTRLTTLANFTIVGQGNKVAYISDVVSWNHYFGWYVPGKFFNKAFFSLMRRFHPKRCVGMSEYGAEAMPNLHSVKPRRGDNTEEYQTEYHAYMAKFISEREYLWATHVWNMFDFAADGRNQGGEPGRNHKGLVTFDRKIRKDAFYVYKAYWSEEPFVHICGKRFKNRTGKKLNLKICSNLPEISVYRNGKFVKTLAGEKVYDVILPMEENNRIEVKNGEFSDEAEFVHVRKEDESYKEKNIGNMASWQK